MVYTFYRFAKLFSDPDWLHHEGPQYKGSCRKIFVKGLLSTKRSYILKTAGFFKYV